jgi:outer membrane immunogenic protein
MPVRKCLPSAIALALMAVTPAIADEYGPFVAAPTNAFDNLFSMAPHVPGGPANPVDWRGLYVGGQVSYSDTSADFSGATEAPIAFSLRELAIEDNISPPPSQWPVLGEATHGGAGLGGFVGYNFEYLTPNMKVVLGFEANVNIASLSVVAPSTPISVVEQDGIGDTDDVHITGGGSLSNLSYGTLRGRVGWGIGNFLPYAFVGFALGNADVNVTETVTLTQHSNTNNPLIPVGPFVFTASAGKDQAWLYGLTAGAGLDIAVSRSLFVRGEYEYVQFQPVVGTDISVNTMHLGLGYRF